MYGGSSAADSDFTAQSLLPNRRAFPRLQTPVAALLKKDSEAIEQNLYATLAMERGSILEKYRMKTRIADLLLLLLLVSFAISSRAGVPPEIVSKGKQATALVEIGDGKGFGSAFCIDAAEGIFVTNEHVAHGLGNSGSVALILHSGEKNQRRVQAIIVRTDKDLDLALLRVKQPKQLTSLLLGSAEDLIETAAITAFGYPFGKELAFANDEYPNVTISTGHITSLRKIKGELAAIQLDAQLNPGNSGGPVLNDKGQVVGIVVAGIEGSGVYFAIPVSHLSYFLRSASIDFTPPGLTADNAHSPQDFAVHVSSFHRSSVGIDVSLTLSAGPEDHRTVTVSQAENQTYTLRAVPLPGPNVPRKLRLTVEDSAGKVVWVVSDQKILVGGSPVLLSTIREIDMEDGPQVRFADKEIRSGSVSRLDTIETIVSGVFSHTNFSRAKRITIESPEVKQPTVSYHVVVKQNGTVIGEKRGTLTIQDFANPPATAANRHSSLVLLISDYNAGVIKQYDGLTGRYMRDFISGNGLKTPGLAVFGPDGDIYVGGSTSSIFRYHGSTGKFKDIFIPKEKNGGAIELTNLVFGTDGNLYASSRWTKEVKRYDGKTGAYIDAFVAKGSGGLDIPGGLLFGPDRNLYVVSTNNDCIKMYDGKTGAYLRDFVSGNGIRGLSDFCFRSDKRLYLACSGSRQVKRFDGETGQFIDNFIGEDLLGGEPAGMVFGPDGNLYILMSSKDVKRFDGRSGRFIDNFVSGNGLERPLCMIFH